MGTPHGLSLAERFWIKVDRRGPAECWPWTAHIKRNGYGAISMGGKYGKVEMAHRVAYMLTHGPIADDKVIDHACHNRACVNPAHLRAVTGQQNNQNRKGANRDSRSGIRGVSWFRPYGKWVVRAYRDGRTHFGGYFDDPEEAGVAAVALRARLAAGVVTPPRGGSSPAEAVARSSARATR